MSAGLEVLKALRIAAAEVDAALLLLSLAQYAIALVCIALSGDASHSSAKEKAKPYSCLGLKWTFRGGLTLYWTHDRTARQQHNTDPHTPGTGNSHVLFALTTVDPYSFLGSDYMP